MSARDFRILILVPLLFGCTPEVEGLEQTLGSRSAAPVSGSGTGASSSGWIPAGTVPNVNQPSTVIPQPATTPVPPPGTAERRTDRYGQSYTTRPGQQVSETAPGSGDFRDGSGRPVQCVSMGPGLSCR